MTTRHLIHDAGHCLSVAAPPAVALGVLTATQFVLTSPTLSAADGGLLLAWHVAIAAAALWLVASVCWAATRPRRDRGAFQRLQQLRDLTAESNRALVHLQTTVWSAAAGQHAVVVNVETGIPYRVWLPEIRVPIGAFVVLERRNSGVSVVDWMDAHQVVEAHRHEKRHPVTDDRGDVSILEREDRSDARQLVEEIQQYLMGQ